MPIRLVLGWTLHNQETRTEDQNSKSGGKHHDG